MTRHALSTVYAEIGHRFPIQAKTFFPFLSKEKKGKVGLVRADRMKKRKEKLWESIYWKDLCSARYLAGVQLNREWVSVSGEPIFSGEEVVVVLVVLVFLLSLENRGWKSHQQKCRRSKISLGNQWTPCSPSPRVGKVCMYVTFFCQYLRNGLVLFAWPGTLGNRKKPRQGKHNVSLTKNPNPSPPIVYNKKSSLGESSAIQYSTEE